MPQQLNFLQYDLNLDIAIDLGGWTANSVPSLFASRIAPTQINYLGFASSGIPELDFWLGDKYLFLNQCTSGI